MKHPSLSDVIFTLAAGATVLSTHLSASDQFLPTATPESQGIPSEAILKYVQAAEADADKAAHSFIVVRNGHAVAEGYWSPYGKEQPHELYSLSKSFTSSAVGLAVEEGLLSIDDKVVDFFPEDIPEGAGDNLKNMRVRQLLTMSTGHLKEPNIFLGSGSRAHAGSTLFGSSTGTRTRKVFSIQYTRQPTCNRPSCKS